MDEGVPGAMVLVRDGGRTRIVSAGRAALSPDVAMRKGQRFKIGSITKPMVATVALQLVDEGRLSLDEPITDIVGDLAGGDPRTGFVRREPHPTDRRATHVVLTDRGAEAARDLQLTNAELAGQLFGDMTDRRSQALHRGLEHVRDRLRELLAEEA